MVAEFTVRVSVELEPDDAEMIESGEMDVSDIDWLYYMDQCCTQELVDIVAL